MADTRVSCILDLISAGLETDQEIMQMIGFGSDVVRAPHRTPSSEPNQAPRLTRTCALENTHVDTRIFTHAHICSCLQYVGSSTHSACV